MQGINFWPIDKNANNRKYVIVAWGSFITVIDNEWWYNATMWGKRALLYNRKKDKELKSNLAKKYPQICKKMLRYAIEDAGGKIPEHMEKLNPNPGCTPLL